MDQLMCASLSHAHNWYELGMLKVCTRLAFDKSMADPLCHRSFVSCRDISLLLCIMLNVMNQIKIK